VTVVRMLSLVAGEVANVPEPIRSKLSAETFASLNIQVGDCDIATSELCQLKAQGPFLSLTLRLRALSPAPLQFQKLLP
jgi:hypothetical protein